MVAVAFVGAAQNSDFNVPVMAYPVGIHTKQYVYIVLTQLKNTAVGAMCS